MNRRRLLEWLSRGLATSVAAVIGLPGMKYVLAVNKDNPANQATFSRLIRLNDLAPGRPTMVSVLGEKTDAWVNSGQQAIGQVWLVREPVGSTVEGATSGQVRAMSSTCPHMGCRIQLQGDGKNFVCPCHRATFALNGQRLTDPRNGERNHAPRDVDELESRLVEDEITGEQWVEVRYETFKTGLDHKIAGV
jgi:menaquinol-cytochrome c reductase iron-sulfur subunit